MAINHLNAPTGNIADNVIGFARALRSAGLPVGPGAVIQILENEGSALLGPQHEVRRNAAAVALESACCGQR